MHHSSQYHAGSLYMRASRTYDIQLRGDISVRSQQVYVFGFHSYDLRRDSLKVTQNLSLDLLTSAFYDNLNPAGHHHVTHPSEHPRT